MIELLNHTIVWWHWVVLGLLFIITEMATGTFISLGLGLAAILVGLIDLGLELGIVYQLLLWIVLSVAIIAGLFKWFKSQPTVSKTGQSSYRLDTLGTVTRAIHPHQRGMVTFDTPVLGNTRWHASSAYDLPKGSRVAIVEVNGQLIEVAPVDQPKQGD
jgi:membrane protein implicated in regulation of membrane protease activity